MPDRSTESVPTRGHKKRERTRRQLLASAIDVIAERGEAFTASDVVERAGVSNGTFYNYFDDREQLIDAVVPEILGAFAAEGAVMVDNRDPAVRFATITALALLRAEDRPDAFRVILRVDAVQRAVVDSDVIGHLRQDLLDGAAAGRFAIGSDAEAPTGDAVLDAAFETSLDAALDVVVGAMLVAARRIVDGRARPDHPRRVVEHLLGSLGLDRAEAATVAEAAVVGATGLVDPGPTSSSNPSSTSNPISTGEDLAR